MEVPQQAPATVPTASDSRASFMLGMLPSLSVMPARDAVPTSVPMVSNMSIMQKVMIRVISGEPADVEEVGKVKLEQGGLRHVAEAGAGRTRPASEAKGFTLQEDKARPPSR